MKTRKAPRSNLKLTVLKQGRPSKNVLSVSFFKMKDPYKTKENFYEGNLILFLHQKNRFRGFEIRIYTDNSGKDFTMNAVKDDPTVTVIHFNDPRFREESIHSGTFATFIRFLPLFEPGLEIVWVSDIDVPDSYLNLSFLSSMKAHNATFSYMNYACYEKKVYGRPYTILAGTMISMHTFPKQLFTNFIDELANPTTSLQTSIDALNKISTERGRPSYKIPYGIDEVFTNGPLYNYLIDQSISCFIRKDYEYSKSYLYSIVSKEDYFIFYQYYRNPTHQLFEKAKSIFKKNLPSVVHQHPCLQEMLKIVDTFKTSFMKMFIKTGKELNESLYPSLEA